MKIFLDMDGVIADFVGGSLQRHSHRPNPYDMLSNRGVFEIEKLWGISPAEFWQPVDDYEFWLNLKKTPEADDIVKLASSLVGIKNVAILTAPSKSPHCFIGKRKWLESNFPQLASRIIFGSAKEFLAGPERILFDDRDKNIKEFNKAGGHAILVPRLWNSYHRRGDVMGAIHEQLEEKELI